MRGQGRSAAAIGLTGLALLIPASASAQTDGSVQPKVVGGHNASISQYPWQAALEYSGGRAAVLRRVAAHLPDRDHRRALRVRRLIPTACDSTTAACTATPVATGPLEIDPNDVDVDPRQHDAQSDGDEGVAVADVTFQVELQPELRTRGAPVRCRLSGALLGIGAAADQDRRH